jgi:DNA-binding NarL/FixJ family response regulator
VRDLRVILADDHALVRAGIRALLEEMDGVEVVGEADDGVGALRLMALHRPEIALVDVSMPRLDGLEVAARARAQYPSTRVLILSMHRDDEYVRRAVDVGAAGYLLKNADRTQMVSAIAAVSRGSTWLSPEVAKKTTGKHGVLTPRQVEVVRLVAEGLSSKEIASHLTVSVKTVQAHREEVAERLGIRGVAGLVRYAIRTGIVEAGR